MVDLHWLYIKARAYTNIFAKKYWIDLILFALAGFLLFFHLGNSQIERWDEFTNIKVINETLSQSSGNFLHLIYNGSPFLEKPPLWYYLNILATKFIGWDMSDYRLISAISGLSLFFLIYLFVKRNFTQAAARYSLLCFLATGQLFFSTNRYFTTHNFRSADLDALQILFIMLSVFFLTNYLKASQSLNTKDGTVYIVLSSLSSALAYLTKGPFGLAPLFILCLYYFINLNKDRSIKLKHVYLYLLVLLITLLPWHLFMYQEYGVVFFEQYINYHLIGRSVHSIEGHNNDLLFYFRILIYPRLFYSPLLIILSIGYVLRDKVLRQIIQMQVVLFLFILNFIAIFIIQTKLAWYLLYIYPFAFIISGVFLCNAKNKFVKAIFLTILLFKVALNIITIYKI